MIDQNIKKLNCKIVIICSFLFNSCGLSILSGTGTHGSLGIYTYTIPKQKLETVIDSIILNDSRIEKLETDSKVYISIKIKNQYSYYFSFRYAGDEKYWELHPNESNLSITAIKKENEIYKSEGEISEQERNEAIKVFEEYFISSINKCLANNNKELK